MSGDNLDCDLTDMVSVLGARSRYHMIIDARLQR
jgi:hypothetical protein